MLSRVIFNLRPFSKKVVRDHLIEQKVRQMTYKPDPKENTSEAETEISDFEDYRANIIHKSSMVGRKYDKKMNKPEADLKDHDFFHISKEYEKTADQYLKNSNYNLDPLDRQRIDKTSRLVRALKLNSSFDFVREKNLDKITEEYNNYSKFDRNYTFYTENTKNEMLDDGNMNNISKISDYMSKIDRLGDINDTARSSLVKLDREGRKISHESYMNMVNQEDAVEFNLTQANDDFIEHADGKMGRMSPHAKEDIYNLYNNGWTVKDIALKYGILPARALAIIWCRRYFYDEIAPNFGRTFWRLGLEREMIYSVDYSFVDYGLDLDVISHFEKGFSSIRLGNTAVDINPPAEFLEKVKNAVKKLPKKKVYTIKRGTVLTGFKKYDVKDIVLRKGNGKLDVSDMFKRICYRGDLTPYSFPKGVQEKLHLGPRAASIGYRVGPKNKRPTRFYNKSYHSQ